MILIALLGQTGSGKSDLAVDLAKKLGDTWIVNCDSRQVYEKLNIGSAKVPGEWKNGVFYYKNIPHYLIDFVDPKKAYTIADYIFDWIKLFETDKTLPKYVILTGGTGLYAKAIIEKYNIQKIKPNFEKTMEKYKKQLEKLSKQKLQNLFKTNCSSEKINQSDYNNPRRLQNRLLRKKGETLKCYEPLIYPKFEKTYQFAIKIDQTKQKERLYKRLQERINQGMVEEIEGLDLPTDRFLDLGLEYRTTKLFLLGQMDPKTWEKDLALEIWHYAKRQLTWLKKQGIIWISSLEEIMSNINDRNKNT